MSVKLILSPVARHELGSILCDLRKLSLSFALKLSNSIELKLNLIRNNPLVGRLRPELGKHLRSVVVNDYLIFNVSTPSKVTVARIIHGSRDLHKAFSN
jgi:toxin ParE1/3/4